MDLRAKYLIFLLAIPLMLLQSCDFNAVYEKNIDFPNTSWMQDSIKTFTFEITEDGSYDLFYIIKNKSEYPFSNLYIKSDLKGENERIANNLQEVTLFDKKTGKPFGKGFGGVMEHKFYALKNQQLSKGNYTLDVQHYMRESQITGIMSFGISVSKSEE